MYLVLFLFFLLVTVAASKGSERPFSLVPCGSSFAPIVRFWFCQHLLCPWPLHGQKRRGKGVSAREVRLFNILPCC